MKYIIDLDGTLLEGTKANLDSVEFMKTLQEKKYDYLIMTNSIKSPKMIFDRLSNVGITVELDKIINPISAMNIYLETHQYTSAYVIGSDSEKEQLNIDVVEENPNIVLLLDFEKEDIAYSKLQKVFDYMLLDIPVITASKSLFYSKSQEKFLDTGSFVTLLEQASGKSIDVIGKPSKDYFMSAITKLKTTPEQVTVVGDDWKTDISGGAAVGCKTVLVKSGKFLKGDEEHDVVTNSVTSLMSILK